MTRAEFARHRGVSKACVTQWAGAGRLVLMADGKVDVEASEARLAQSVRIPSGEHDVGAVGAREARRFEADTRTPADDHHGLAEEILLVTRVGGERCVGHGLSRVRAANTALVVAPNTRWSESAPRDLSRQLRTTWRTSSM